MAAWCCCTTTRSSATAALCPGRASCIPPRDPNASSARTRTPKSAVGERRGGVKGPFKAASGCTLLRRLSLGSCVYLGLHLERDAVVFIVFPQKSIGAVKVSYLNADMHNHTCLCVCNETSCGLAVECKSIDLNVSRFNSASYVKHFPSEQISQQKNCMVTDGLSLCLCEFQRTRVTFATRCAREAAGVRGPASVCPVGPSSAA